MTNLPAEISAMRDDLENDMSHHYCHKPDDPCYIQDFVNNWFPAVLDNFVGGAAQDVCTNLGACAGGNVTLREVTCAECTTGLHALSKWLESEEQVVQHVAFLQEGVCTGCGECAGAVADWYPDMIKHATQNFLTPHATPVLCSQFCDVTTGPPTIAGPTTSGPTTAEPTTSQPTTAA